VRNIKYYILTPPICQHQISYFFALDIQTAKLSISPASFSALIED